MKEERIPSDQLIVAEKQHIKERDYWLKKMSGDLLKSTFFPDNIRTADQRSMKTAVFNLSVTLVSQLQTLSKDSDVKRHMIFLAGMVILLHKHTRNKDIIVGTPIYRQKVEGDFINTILPLRFQLEEEMSFKQLLSLVRQTVHQAVEHQSYPMKILLERLNMPLTLGEDFPLFDTAVLVESIHDKNYLQHIHCNFIFSFFTAVPPHDEVRLTVEYNSKKYRPSTMQRIVEHFENLLQHAFFNPDQSIYTLNILSEQERKRLLMDFNDSKGEFPADKVIHEVFRERVNITPAAIAVVHKNAYLSYRELHRRAQGLAKVLRSKGVGPDSIVGLMEERSLEMIIGIMAILLAGGAYLPVDPQTPKERVISMLEDSGAPVLLSTSAVIKNHSYTTLQGLRSGRTQLHRTAPRPTINNFDDLPMPDRSLVNYESYNKYIGITFVKNTISLQATRGCPFKCVYCHKIWPKTHVARSAENIFEEVFFYYKMGVRRFVFVDDVFNLNVQNSTRFFQLILKNKLDLQLFFSGGLRGDILTEDYIDLMVEAGTVEIGFSLETASPRLQKLMGKNLNLDKFKKNAQYLCQKHPRVIFIFNTMHGFPTETEDEALMTLDFIKSLHWLHFPYIHVVKIYHDTEIERLALANGVTPEAIERSEGLAYHELSDTLPFEKSFTLKYQADFFNDYVMSKERLLNVLPIQLKLLTDDEIVQKYDSYLPAAITSVDDLLEFFNIDKEELQPLASETPLHQYIPSPGLNRRMKEAFPSEIPAADALRILLLDLSMHFSEGPQLLYDVVEPPLGLMYLFTYLKAQLGAQVHGKVAKSRIDFDSFGELKVLIENFKPDIIGIRTLSFYKEFFHQAAARIRQWGIEILIIAGGPYATADYAILLQDRNVDLVVMGEGELTFCHLIEKIIEHNGKLPPEPVLKEINGIVFPETRANVSQRFTREIVLMDTLAEMAAADQEKPLENINRPLDLAYNIYTSGSTGKPKGVLLEHCHLVNLMWYHLYHSGLNLNRVLQFATINFDVSIQEIFPPLLAGGTLFLIDRHMMTDIPVLFGFVEKNDIKTLFLPASFLKFVLNEEDYVALLPRRVEHIVPAGEQLIVTEAFKKYLKANSIFLHNHYGPSETHLCTVLTVDPRGEIPGLPSIGKPTLNATIYIVDKDLGLQPIGVPGQIYIGGLQVGRGFLGRVQMTAEKFLPDPFAGPPGRMYHSGDLGRWLEDGNIEFLGRIDHQVKIRGFRIELGEIESRLIKVKHIKEAAVVDRVDKTGQKYLCAYIVSHQIIDVTVLRENLARHLPDYMIPSYFVNIEKIPLTFNRKVDRKALPDPELSQKGQEIKQKPRNQIEAKLAALWSEILEINQDIMSIDASFFDLGGHSLKATILTSKIHKEFNIKVPLIEMFRTPTIRELAEYIRRSGKDQFVSIEPAEKKEFYQLSSAQKRLYVFQHLDIDITIFNLPVFFTLEGEVEEARFRETFRELIKRHEAFRTSFEPIDGEPVQRIRKENSNFQITNYNQIQYSELQITNIIKNFIRPFDLSNAPLLRVGLIKQEQTRHILMVDMHHIITDGSSMKILIREFMELYQGKSLPRFRLQYKDYSRWQNRLLASGEIQKQQDYWLNQFKGDVPALNLPSDYPKSSDQSFKGDSISFKIDAKMTDKLKKLISSTGKTLYVALLAVYNILLSKYTGQHDIIVGSGVAGRRHADLENIIGFFVNMLAIRNRPAPVKTFSEFLSEVEKNTVNAYENQDYQFEELIKKLHLQGTVARNPLIETVLHLRDIEYPELQIKGLKLKNYPNENNTIRFDLITYAADRGDTIDMMISYSTGLFKPSTVEGISRNYLEVLDQVIDNKNVKLEDITITTHLLDAKSDIFKEDQSDFGFDQ